MLYNSKSFGLGKHTLSFCVAAVAIASSSQAAMTGIYRTDTPNGTATAFWGYSSISALANNTGGTSAGSISVGIANSRYTYVFGDFTQSQNTNGYVYKTVYGGNGRTSQIVRYLASPTDALSNLRSDTGGQTFNLVTPGGTGWDREDDFFCDGTNFYRNRTANGGSNGVTKYGSFLDLVNDTNGTLYSYSTTYGYNDRFFAFEGKFYRTNTGGPNGSVSGFCQYNSFNDLLNGTIASTINTGSGINWSASDFFVPVPAPGAMALLGLAGAIGNRRARR